MIHNYLDRESNGAEHWAVGIAGDGSGLLVQLGDNETQVRLIMKPEAVMAMVAEMHEKLALLPASKAEYERIMAVHAAAQAARGTSENEMLRDEDRIDPEAVMRAPHHAAFHEAATDFGLAVEADAADPAGRPVPSGS